MMDGIWACIFGLTVMVISNRIYIKNLEKRIEKLEKTKNNLDPTTYE